MIETIVKRDLPDEFSATYQAKGVNNWITNRFVAEGPDRTRWVMDNRLKLSGLMALMGVFMQGSFRKQTLEDMSRFRVFAYSD